MPTTSAVNGRLWGSSAEDWSSIQEQVSRPIYVATFDRLLVRGMRYVDLGCGAGMAAQIAFERGAQVTGLDAAENLLAIARQRTPKGDFRLGELESLPFGDQSFDLVTGFNSLQYAGNPIAALKEAKRVAKRGAKVVVATWGQPEGMEAASLVVALRPLLPSPPPGAPGPFALSDPNALEDFVAAAGLEPEELFDVKCPWHYAGLQQALRGLRSSGVAAKAIDHSGRDAVDLAHTKALAPFRREDGSYRITSSFRFLIANA